MFYGVQTFASVRRGSFAARTFVGTSVGALTRLAMKLMAYTFVRTSELIEAEWQEFDLDNARWDIPAERMKMDTPHIVPLSQQSVAVLRALSLLTGNRKLVFPGAHDKEKPMSNNTILFALYRLGYKGRMATITAFAMALCPWSFSTRWASSLRPRFGLRGLNLCRLCRRARGAVLPDGCAEMSSISRLLPKNLPCA